MIKVKVIHLTKSDDGMTGLAVVQDGAAIYFIDSWRHAHDKSEDRIDKLSIGDTCYIEEWFLSMRKKDYNNLPTI